MSLGVWDWSYPTFLSSNYFGGARSDERTIERKWFQCDGTITTLDPSNVAHLWIDVNTTMIALDDTGIDARGT